MVNQTALPGDGWKRDKRPIIFSMSRLDKVKNLTGLTWGLCY